ncbi:MULTISPECIES: hypothetical protein [unclassified Sphingomonas]|uniref:hypothetical protein n=1 Tax=unclassified Sphingomonas TaxID=196159 RepID=UPI0006F4861B|nr:MULTISPECIES: hypothetical protein [unclassified Sphingomonas]KRB94591.1 hypothetical protein ASE22_01200 [Sphingomonas sp. Root720]
MKSIFAGGATIALILMATTASAQVGGALGASAGGGGSQVSAGANVQTPGTGAVVDAQADAQTEQAGTDLKRATRKSHRDIATTANGKATVGGSAAVPSSSEPRTPDGGS